MESFGQRGVECQAVARATLECPWHDERPPLSMAEDFFFGHSIFTTVPQQQRPHPLYQTTPKLFRCRLHYPHQLDTHTTNSVSFTLITQQKYAIHCTASRVLFDNNRSSGALFLLLQRRVSMVAGQGRLHPARFA